MAYTLNETTIKTPSDFDISFYTLTKSTRLLNGDMTMAYINKKRKFTLTYAAIQSMELDTIIDILWTNQDVTGCFHTLGYEDNGVAKTATIYAGEIPKKLHHKSNGVAGRQNWVWKDVTISLIER